MYWSNLIIPYCLSIFQILSGRWPNGWAPLLGRGVRSSNLHCLIYAYYFMYIEYTHCSNGDSSLTINLRFVEVRISTAWFSIKFSMIIYYIVHEEFLTFIKQKIFLVRISTAYIPIRVSIHYIIYYGNQLRFNTRNSTIISQRYLIRTWVYYLIYFIENR